MAEELEKEARFRTKGWKEQENCVQAYIIGAEPREKRIAELEKENSELKSDNEARKFAMIMSGKVEKQLREENAELKEIIDNDVDKKIYVQLAKKAELADVQKEQLTKAKELLAKWVELFKPKGGNIPPTPIQVDTEQFLNEVEK